MRLLLPALLLSSSLFRPPLHAHDIVTTAVTWNREISRIVYARCASCHHLGGPAFTLLTYQAARPWAAAIKADVLQRRMPPWGAVKGFGEFRNDQALTAEQMDSIIGWADGGMPEGDPKDLPPPPDTAAPPAYKTAGPLEVQGSAILQTTLRLDGFVPQGIPANSNFKIIAELPNGSRQPLVWLRGYDSRLAHPFLLRRTLKLPAGTKITGLIPGTSLLLVPAQGP